MSKEKESQDRGNLIVGFIFVSIIIIGFIVKYFL